MHSAPAGVCLFVLVSGIAGFSPLALAWAGIAVTEAQHLDPPWSMIWASGVACYLLHGAFLELVPAPPPDEAKHCSPLPLRAIWKNVSLNLLSTALLLPFAPDERTRESGASDSLSTLAYLVFALLGNEVFYTAAHAALHWPSLYRYHALHHMQKFPRPLGAAFCHPLEMWVANLFSFLCPLLLIGAPRGVVLVWIVAGVMGTQHHHACKMFAWTRALSDRQPEYHTSHHVRPDGKFGNLGGIVLGSRPRKDCPG